jgi:hypothetical protein
MWDLLLRNYKLDLFGSGFDSQWNKFFTASLGLYVITAVASGGSVLFKRISTPLFAVLMLANLIGLAGFIFPSHFHANFVNGTSTILHGHYTGFSFSTLKDNLLAPNDAVIGPTGQTVNFEYMFVLIFQVELFYLFSQLYVILLNANYSFISYLLLSNC